mmetsp:Transcript_5216/g.8081  ORF Transcript_5216/g.8081 Transcript_5216/m.8081 type:complete len:208 (-) Transcript_5216:649-1272(-)|eukprot:CAMPEP_0184644596 /NCGR_PEP_ID=MMETSP0308-20130426/1297_1 /TAXON_ID=38269 /ORGANISM="Gloeochaete witrockiana, Strain SAG 46.84" /LENGTH=207 /DNA_ID=CAMNT_0027073223 /DNA_START=192 /DNA_END=815 /DNA_ORIENTATION=+
MSDRRRADVDRDRDREEWERDRRDKERERDRSRSPRRRDRKRDRSRSPHRGSPPRRRSPSRRSRSRSLTPPEIREARRRQLALSDSENEDNGTKPKDSLEKGRSKTSETSKKSKVAPVEEVEEDEDSKIRRMMGLPGGFDSTKGKKVEGADISAVKLKSQRHYRQYMNRKGGFNRPLDEEKPVKGPTFQVRMGGMQKVDRKKKPAKQ